jgi:hypothetical protein
MMEEGLMAGGDGGVADPSDVRQAGRVNSGNSAKGEKNGNRNFSI